MRNFQVSSLLKYAAFLILILLMLSSCSFDYTYRYIDPLDTTESKWTPIKKEKQAMIISKNSNVYREQYRPLDIKLPSYAGEKEYVAVINLIPKMNVTKELASFLSDYLRGSLVKTNRYKVVDRNNMDIILKEQGFQLQDCTSSECVVKVGQLLGVEKMIIGSIGKLKDTYFISIQLTNVETALIEKTANEKCPCNEDELPLAIDTVVKKLIVEIK